MTAMAEDVANEIPVELPRLTITSDRELPPPESWRYAEAPRFIILSNASPVTTQRLMRDLELFEMALSTVWPSTAPGPRDTPTRSRLRVHFTRTRATRTAACASASSRRT